MSAAQRWGILWRSENRLDGKREFVTWHECKPLLFRTRKEAREWIEQRYGYIRRSPDLQAEPHGWKMPKAVRVTVRIEPV